MFLQKWYHVYTHCHNTCYTGLKYVYANKSFIYYCINNIIADTLTNYTRKTYFDATETVRMSLPAVFDVSRLTKPFSQDPFHGPQWRSSRCILRLMSAAAPIFTRRDSPDSLQRRLQLPNGTPCNGRSAHKASARVSPSA